MPKAPLLLCLGLAAWAAWIVSDLRLTIAAPAPVRPSSPRPYGVDWPRGFEAAYAANTSCASASCHGSGAVGQTGGEQSTWAASGTRNDPHRNAYAVLFNPTSVQMVRNLKLTTAAHQTTLCLKCHALDEDKSYDGEKLATRVHSEGVACESCHGPSGKWLTAHYEAGWKGLTNREKWEQFGFTPTKNLVSRALTCTQCHVGSADREVNHDLIAAGHPRLNFEYTRFHFAPRYLHHWKEAVEQPDFELRAWYIGQLANLRASVGLLESRAARAAATEAVAGGTPWPEFAESSCYACHQTIARPTLRGQQEGRTRPSGVPPWQTWYTPTLGVLPAVHPLLLPGSALPNVPDLELLRGTMQRSRPNPAEVRTLAAAAGRDLDAWLARVQDAEDRGAFATVTPEAAVALGRLLTRSVLNDAGNDLRDHDWDFVAQHYLGLAAAYHAAGGSDPGSPVASWKGPLDELGRTLAFPEPAAGVKVNSPRDYQPRVALEQLQKIHSLTAPTRTSR